MRAREAAERHLSARRDLDDPAIFISLRDESRLTDDAERVDGGPADEVPLRGLTFAVKDNIEAAGMSTTAGCPRYSYLPERSARVVELLEGAGALLVGTTNLDQFTTGLVGTRSPYGVPRNPIDAAHVPGGSSSGSAVAVARGLVDFALGTDTAGSGRVPAAFCGVVGLKPTVGSVSTRGVVPAVRSLDCVSVFAPTVSVAARVGQVIAGFDAEDPFSRHAPAAMPRSEPSSVRLGVLDPAVLGEWGADAATVAAYGAAVERLRELVSEMRAVDFAPFAAVGDLLYGGPWLAQRTLAVGDFITEHRDEVDPIVGPIIESGASYSAIDVWTAGERLAELRRRVDVEMHGVSGLVLPTTPGGATLGDIAADPVGRNAELGRFTTFTNLLGWCGVTVPAGVRDGEAVPPSVTLYGPPWSDGSMLELAASFVGEPTPPGAGSALGTDGDLVELAVAGAHLRGQPLEHQLVELGARWVETTRTAPTYRLYALAGTEPAKPALVAADDGRDIEVDVWRLSPDGLGRFLQLIPEPLALGKVALADERVVTGFVCESGGITDAVDITHNGGWRAYMAAV